jgi:hypothetical protein
MTLIERLKTAKAYTPQQLGGDVFRSVGGELKIPATHCILVSIETRDEIIKLLSA